MMENGRIDVLRPAHIVPGIRLIVSFDANPGMIPVEYRNDVIDSHYPLYCKGNLGRNLHGFDREDVPAGAFGIREFSFDEENPEILAAMAVDEDPLRDQARALRVVEQVAREESVWPLFIFSADNREECLERLVALKRYIPAEKFETLVSDAWLWSLWHFSGLAEPETETEPEPVEPKKPEHRRIRIFS